MKKILLLIICALCVILMRAQPRGYFWYFNSAPYNSIPAVGGSPGNYALIPVGPGPITPGTASTLVLGSSCNGSFQVARLLKPAGFIFNNDPSFITGSYTIELVCSYDDVSGYRKLIDFFYPLGGFDYAIYINEGSLNVFLNAGTGTVITAPVFVPNSYFQLDMTRDAATKLVSFYQNGIAIGSFIDINNYFTPGTFTQNIRLFKDNTDIFEESDTRVAKIGIFNSVLSPSQIQQNFNNICNSSFFLLPVSLKNFIAKKMGQQVELSWTTSQEQNNRGFEIQRSSDGINFSRIGWIDGIGNSSTEHSYRFLDMAPVKGKNFYRLLQTDLDGRTTHSPVQKVDLGNSPGMNIFPNPVVSQLTIQFTDQSEKEITVTDMVGRNVWARKNIVSLSIDVPVHQLIPGVYIVIVRDNNGYRVNQKFIKE